MKHGGKLRAWLAGGLALGIAVPTAMAVGTDNPYETIVARNVFGLRSPPPPPDPEANKPPLPKLSLTGIVTFGGAKRALLKTAAGPPKPGQPANKPESYIIEVGQRQDDIEVLAIDEKAGVVKVNYGGTVTDLDFENDGIKAPPAPAPAPGARPRPGVVPLPPTKTVTAVPRPAGAHSAVPTPFPTRTMRTGSTATPYTPQGAYVGGGRPAVNVGGATLNLAGGSQSRNPVAERQAALPQRSMEENLLMLEANRLKHQQEIKAGLYPPLPRHPAMEAYKAEEAAKAGFAPQ
jgi:hypothetical protein